METTVHNPDRYMGDLRQILAQGRKRIGILLGAGAPASISVDATSRKIDPSGTSLIPTIAGLTTTVVERLNDHDQAILANVSKELGHYPNIEQILSRVRSFANLIGCNSVYGCDGKTYSELADKICRGIGEMVNAPLPQESNAYLELAGWIGGTDRVHAIEIFTPNYDLLMEEALERKEIPYFDGFSGAFEPFFDAPSISTNDLPSRWVRLWKLHGSLGWAVNGCGGIVRGKGRNATQLIYPDHLKYDQIQKLPFTAFFDRLRKFLTTPDTLLLTCGFSFADRHISAVIDESLAANLAASVFAFQYRSLSNEGPASAIANKRSNMSVYAKDAAIVNGISAPWSPRELPNPDWAAIRSSFWGTQQQKGEESFRLGDFSAFVRFVVLTHAERVAVPDEIKQGEAK